MTDTQQLGLADHLLNSRRKQSKMLSKLLKIDELVDWKRVVDQVSVIDKTKSGKGGRPRKDPMWMIKAIFLQYLFNLSDPQLEDQLIDRLSFQRFTGINLDQHIPDFTTFWRFKEALIDHNLDQKIFDEINRQIEDRGLLVKKGTIVDAAIIESSNRPLSKQKRQELKSEPSSQIDTDARSTKKNNSWFFGYKGHIGVDIESKLIRKATFTPASVHDSTQTEYLVSYDEASLFGDKAYCNVRHKYSARRYGWYYGVLEKPDRGQTLSKKQHKRNKQWSSVRGAVEHPFAHMKTKAGLTTMAAKNQARNGLRFVFNCIGWNLERMVFLVHGTRSVGLVAL
ncbi:MAG: IS5 family transposase [Candidatus Paceibacterota bacterium]